MPVYIGDDATTGMEHESSIGRTTKFRPDMPAYRGRARAAIGPGVPAGLARSILQFALADRSVEPDLTRFGMSRDIGVASPLAAVPATPARTSGILRSGRKPRARSVDGTCCSCDAVQRKLKQMKRRSRQAAPGTMLFWYTAR